MDRNTDSQEDLGLVTVGEYFTPIEAEWARSVLASAGLCSMMPDQMMGFMLEGATGPIRLQVPSAKAEEARAILAEMEFERGLYLEAREHGEADEADEMLEAEDVPAVDPHDLCPKPPSPACPTCGSSDVAPCAPPAYAADGPVTAFLKRLVGRGWMRCEGCGATWEG
jgi:hypothetical protein